MKEEIFVISQRDRNGNFNKLCKSLDTIYYTAGDAARALAIEPEYIRNTFSVFRLVITLDIIEKL